jgi:hypothetical protein
MTRNAYYSHNKIYLTKVHNPAIGKPIQLPPTRLMAEVPDYLYLGKGPGDRPSTSEAFLTSEECRDALDRNGHGDYSLWKIEVVPCNPRYSGQLFTFEGEPTVEAEVVVWNDATLLLPIYDLPAGMVVDCIQQPLDVQELWFYEKGGILLATAPLNRPA